jgi:3' terminal RNA ribose 2'-O-methyltransferase Hen1
VTVQALLSHLYILLPVCDNDKHYWVGQHEIEKLLEKGKDWLAGHPAKELITMRYLKNRKQLANQALDVLLEAEGEIVGEEGTESEAAAGEVGVGLATVGGMTVEAAAVVAAEPKVRAHDQRLAAVRDELLACGAASVVDLGCGEGKLLRLLIPEKQFERILGMDVSYRSLEIAKDNLKLERLSAKQQARLHLIQGSLAYRDRRIEGFDAGALVEVIEHLDEPRLAALESTVFAYARPRTVVITTPNAEYNKLFEGYVEGKMRHSDHRFEWTRAEFEEWGNRIARKYDYTVQYKPVGEVDVNVGALSQMAVFTKK